MDETIAIGLKNLSKTFGHDAAGVCAVSGLTLDIRAGQVYGFLGPNGAGKTTTIRMILALIRPSQGRVCVYGREVQEHPAVLQRVGALVEGPAFYGYLSGRENLEILSHTANDYRPAHIQHLLHQAGLAGSEHRQVSRYSLGMRQRLGIAAALLNDPDLVILDEPTNGLDPAGIQEMRQFIRDLADQQGKTVFLSSHLLNEVEQVCDRVAIIHKGRLIREGAVPELVAEGTRLRIQAAPIEDAAEVLRGLGAVSAGAGWLTITAAASDSSDLIRQLVTHNIRVYQVVVERQTLEEFFMAATQA